MEVRAEAVASTIDLIGQQASGHIHFSGIAFGHAQYSIFGGRVGRLRFPNYEGIFTDLLGAT